MTSRRLLILSAAALVAIALGLWLATSNQSGSQAEQQALYPELKANLDKVTAVQIFKAGDARAVELARKDNAWVVSERAGFPADEAKLRKLLVALADARMYEEKTSNPEQYATLGVEDVSGEKASGTRIELVGAPKPVNLIVGKQGMGASSQYVRRAGEAQSWLINTHLDASATADAWLRKEIINVAADRVQSANVSIKGAKSYTAAKSSRADADFKVEGLPKGKSLSSPAAANNFATALTGLSLADVQAASAFGTDAPDRATFKTFDGLIVQIDGWTRADKHYIALKTSFDPAHAERFRIATAPVEAQKQDSANGEGAQEAKQEATNDPGNDAPKAQAAPNVEEEAKSASTKLEGWVYEIPQYKYEAIFKPVDQLT